MACSRVGACTISSMTKFDIVEKPIRDPIEALESVFEKRTVYNTRAEKRNALINIQEYQNPEKSREVKLRVNLVANSAQPIAAIRASSAAICNSVFGASVGSRR